MLLEPHLHSRPTFARNVKLKWRRSAAGGDPICEVAHVTTYVRHHLERVALVLSAKRHFADERRTGLTSAMHGQGEVNKPGSCRAGQ
ncbi:cryptochrome/photolyase family protein [Ensifer sp. HO-A22]|uniref:Cryptochrome/photolyase family protein n=1 Tax=Ensifer oleiphilus TaxID=2742698 RepID=A0A7Y6UN58_9HYPH|nr:cryptochrome/photolyase family protein [Ensifer oleiphilus]